MRTDRRTDTHDEANSRFSKSQKHLTKSKLLMVGDGEEVRGCCYNRDYVSSFPKA